MTLQEIQYLLQTLNNADIKGQVSVFHAQLTHKLALMGKELQEKEQQEKEPKDNAD